MAAGTGEGGEQAAGEEEGDASAELLTQQGSIQEAVFGVLYTLSKERLNEGWRFVVFAMVLDYLQLAVFFIGNNFPWNYNFYAWYWKWLSWVCLTNMFPKGTGLIDGNYNLYLAIFFVLTGFLVVSAALCIFVGINFKSNHFPYVWPIKVLKLAVSFFFELFYISTLGIFIIALDCTYYNPVKVNEKFRSELCFKMPHLVVVAISIVTSLLAMAMAYFIAVANSELDPLSKELNSQAHNRSALKRYALISLITVINEVFPSYTKIQGIACIIIMGYLCHNYVRYMPFQTAWINGLQASFFASLTWASFLIILMAFFYPYSNHEAFSVLVWVGLLAVIPLVWVVLYFRVRHTHKVALMYRMALKSDNGPVIHKFVDELEVEIVARCGRIRDKYGELMPVWVDTAEAVYKAGLAQFPESAYLNIAYSSFLIHHRSAMQASMGKSLFLWVGAGLLEVARKLEPSIGERFMIFVRDREQKQRGGSGADGSSYDLLSYVEYQNNFKALMAVHRQALKANRSFWRQLVRKDIAFEDLTRAFSAMETAEKRADSTFRMVLDRYPNNPKLLLAYALYLETVKSNPSHATRYRAEAARCDKTSPQAAQNPALTDGFEGSGESAVTADRSSGAIMDNSADAMVVINDKGVIQFVNKKLLEMFGYKQGQLEGKNVAGKAFRVGKSAFHTVALHAQGFSLPVTLAIKELQQGDAKAYRGVFKPASLHNAFGYSLADIRGELVGSVGADDGLTQQFKTVAELLKKWEFSAAELGTSMHTFQVALKHKYGAVFPASGSVSFAGTDAVRLMAFKFALAEGVEKLALISMTPAGQVVYANPTLEKMLGYEPGFLVGKQKTIRELVRPPYGQLHLRWMLQAAQNAEYNSMAPCSCRTGRGVLLVGRNNVQVPVTMRVVEAEVGKMRCLTASITQLEVPEPDAWGGGDVKDVWNNSKRLLLLVHADGRVLAYKADPDTALHGFGQNVTELCGKFVSEVVKDFTKPAGFSKDWPSVPHLLARLAQQTSKAHAAGGAPSFRVGVVPSATAPAQLKQKPKGHAHATIPCRMIVLPVADSELELQELLDAGTLKEEDVSSGQLHVVKLRQDDMIEAVLEIDAQMKIKAAAGRPDSSSRVEDFLAVKRTQLKRGDHQAVGEKLEMEALHADGSRMLVQLQGADKYADGRSEHSQDDATSNMDGVSMGDSEAAESHGNFNNYQRAKRFRKLNKMLSSPKAQQRIRILKWTSIAMLFLLLGVHALFFGLTSQGIKDYESFFKDIVVAVPTWAAYYLGYYTPWVSKKAANFEEFTRELMFGFDRNHLTMPSTEDLRVLFLSNAIAVKQVSPTRSLNMSLWDLSVRFATAGQLMAATAPTAAGASLANMSELTIFVASEAGGLIPLCCLCLYLLLKRVNQARLKLFNVFLAVPRPVVMQLATREVQVSLDPEDGDEDDGDAWLRQAEAGSGSSPAKGVGFNLTTAKRKLRTNGLASYIMLSPFLLWSIIVAIVFAISIFRLRGSSASLYVGYAFSRAIGIAFTSSATEANSLQTELVGNLPTVTKYLQGLLYGDASLGLEGAVRLNNHHEELWFGQGCLSTNSSTCLQPSSPYYEDGLTTNTANFVSDGQGRMTLITVLQVLTMVLGVIMVLFFYFRMLMPFMRHSKKESRRVAELMSQLPAEMNVEYLVLSSTNQDDEEEELVEGQPAKTWMGRLFASCWGRGKAGVLPDPKQAAGREAANLNIVVSQNTSKDKEASRLTDIKPGWYMKTPVASPAVGAHDVSTKFNKAFKEKMHRHRSERDEDEEDDPTLWDSHLSPRKVAFA
ncbi:hypothetical protein N2152v2_003764 [Parachlorella kessleri]